MMKFEKARPADKTNQSVPAETAESRNLRRKREDAKLKAALGSLASALRDIDELTAHLTVPERAALVRREMETYQADDALDNVVSWFELED